MTNEANGRKTGDLKFSFPPDYAAGWTYYGEQYILWRTSNVYIASSKETKTLKIFSKHSDMVNEIEVYILYRDVYFSFHHIKTYHKSIIN